MDFASLTPSAVVGWTNLPHAVGLFRIVVRLIGFVALMEIRKEMIHFTLLILTIGQRRRKFRSTGKDYGDYRRTYPFEPEKSTYRDEVVMPSTYRVRIEP